MRKDDLLEILEDWNFWKKNLESGIKRKHYLEQGERFLKTNVIIAIIGVRRSGKSYVIRQMVKRMIENGIDRKNMLIVNFEDKRFAEFYPNLLDEVYETYLEFLKPDKEHFVFLDEIHNVPAWERWARTMNELGKAKIILSGSSSKLLSGELSTVLTGRHLDVYTFPLGFKEFLSFKNKEIKDKLDMLGKKIEILQSLNEYVEFGGFPEVVLSEEKKQLLLTYFDDILTKDIEKRYKLKKTEQLRALARFYLTNMSSRITFNSLKKFLDITTTTIEKFSSYLEEANILFFIKRFSFKVKEQEKAPRKVYSIDVGLANSVGFRFSENIGKAAENIVAIELLKKSKSNPNLETYYWTDYSGKEVDFVIKENLKIKQLIQVCRDLSNFKTEKREVSALLKAMTVFDLNEGLIITNEYENEEITKGRTIKFVPLWKWLLEKNDF